MLIPSPRHTPADLRLWAGLEAADRALGNSMALHKQVGRSVNAIRSFVAGGPCYAGCSCGKDSVVLAGLLDEAGVRVPVVWVDAGEEHNPGGEAVWEALQSAVPSLEYHRVVVPRLKGITEKMRGTIEQGFDQAVERFGDRYLSGVRAAESGTRKLSMRRLGTATPRTCRPIGWWKVAEVFAYLAARRLPVHSNYAMLGGGRWPRTDHAPRVALLGGLRGAQFGRAQWEYEYFPDLINRMAAAAASR